MTSPLHLLKSSGKCIKSPEGHELQINLVARSISTSHSQFNWIFKVSIDIINMDTAAVYRE